MSILSNQIELNKNLNGIKEEAIENTNKILLKQDQESVSINKLSEDIRSIFSTQDVTLSHLDEFKDEILVKEDKSIADINEIEASLSNLNRFFDELSKDNNKIIEALLSNQEHFTMDLKRNYDLLTDVEELGLRVEKSSAYTNIKLDTKFDDNNRLLNEYSDRLYDRIVRLLNEK